MNRAKSEYPRDTTINIRVSKAERALIRRRANELGISVSAYLVGLALGYESQLKLSDQERV